MSQLERMPVAPAGPTCDLTALQQLPEADEPAEVDVETAIWATTGVSYAVPRAVPARPVLPPGAVGQELLIAWTCASTTSGTSAPCRWPR